MDVKAKIIDFLDFVETINEQYIAAQHKLEEAERISADGLHYLEFAENASAVEMANAARKLQQARKQRREAKETILTAAFFIEWCKNNGQAVYDLRGLLTAPPSENDIPLEDRYYNNRSDSFRDEFASIGKLPPPKPVIWIDKHGNESYFKSVNSAARSLGLNRDDILACCRYQLDEIDGQRFRFYSDSLDERYKPEEEEPQEPEPVPVPAPKRNTAAKAIRLTDANGDTLEYPSVSQAIDDLAVPSKSALYKALKNGTEYHGFLWEYIT